MSSLFVAIICLIEKRKVRGEKVSKRKKEKWEESIEILIDVCFACRNWKRFLWAVGPVCVTSRRPNDRSAVIQYHQDSTRWLIICL